MYKKEMFSYDTNMVHVTNFYCWIIGSIVTVFLGLATTILVFLTIHHRPDKSGSYINAFMLPPNYN